MSESQKNLAIAEKKLADSQAKQKKREEYNLFIKQTKDGISALVDLARAVGPGNGTVTKYDKRGEAHVLEKKHLAELKRQVFERLRSVSKEYNKYKKRTNSTGGQLAPALFNQDLLGLYRDTNFLNVLYQKTDNTCELVKGGRLNDFLYFLHPTVTLDNGDLVSNPVYGIFQQGGLMKLIAIYLAIANTFNKVNGTFKVPTEMSTKLASLFNKIEDETGNKWARNKTKDSQGKVTIDFKKAEFNRQYFPVSHYPKVNGAARLPKPNTDLIRQLDDILDPVERLQTAVLSGVQLTSEQLSALNPYIYATFVNVASVAPHLDGLNATTGVASNGRTALSVLLDFQKQLIVDTVECIKLANPELFAKKTKAKKTL